MVLKEIIVCSECGESKTITTKKTASARQKVHLEVARAKREYKRREKTKSVEPVIEPKVEPVIETKVEEPLVEEARLEKVQPKRYLNLF
jgi:hypothetical protein